MACSFYSRSLCNHRLSHMEISGRTCMITQYFENLEINLNITL